MSGENALKQAAVLARQIVRAFFDPEEVVVFDLVVRRTLTAAEAASTTIIRSTILPTSDNIASLPGRISVQDVSEKINFSKRMTQIYLLNLQRAGLIICEAAKDSGAHGKGQQQTLYFSFDYRSFAKKLKYRHLKLHQIFESLAQKAPPEDQYICVNDSCPDLYVDFCDVMRHLT
jgi:transcription initiation factor IIE alpha subunit